VSEEENKKAFQQYGTGIGIGIFNDNVDENQSTTNRQITWILHKKKI